MKTFSAICAIHAQDGLNSIDAVKQTSMGQRIAIIGASGELGSKLLQQLATTDCRIVAVVRNKNKRDFSSYSNVEVKEIGDISNTKALGHALENVDTIINTGYIWFAPAIHKAIVNGAQLPKHILFTGSTRIFTRYNCNNSQQKKAAELFIQNQFEIPWTIIRPTMIYGHSNDKNISKLTRLLKKTPVMPLIGKGNNLIQPVFIDDLIRAFLLAIESTEMHYQTYNIGGRHPITNKELFKTVGHTLNKNLTTVPIPVFIITTLVRLLQVFKITKISQDQIKRFQENKDIDIAPFESAFGFTPRTFQEGVKQMIANEKL